MRLADVPAVLAAPVPVSPTITMSWKPNTVKQEASTTSNKYMGASQNTGTSQRRLSLSWQLPGGPGSPVLAIQDYLESSSQRGSRRGSVSLLRGLLEEYSTRDPSVDPTMTSADMGIPYAAKVEQMNDTATPAQPPIPATPLTLTASWELPLPDPAILNGVASLDGRWPGDGSGGESEPVSEFEDDSDPLSILPMLFPSAFQSADSGTSNAGPVKKPILEPPSSSVVHGSQSVSANLPQRQSSLSVSFPLHFPRTTAQSKAADRPLQQNVPCATKIHSPFSGRPQNDAGARGAPVSTSSTLSLNKQCTYCKKTFLCESKLQRHLRTHTGEKPFACLCEQTFTQKSSLKTHIMRHAAMKHKRKAGGKRHGVKKMKLARGVTNA